MFLDSSIKKNTAYGCLIFALSNCQSPQPERTSPDSIPPDPAVSEPDLNKTSPQTTSYPKLINSEVTPAQNLQDILDSKHRQGVIAIYNSKTQQLYCSDPELCRQAKLPASTFKIPHALIALELGIVADSSTMIPWDGLKYTVDSWNQDMTLKEAMQRSCVPCFQSFARNIGEERMSSWLQKIDYGNHDIGGGIDTFWLDGDLRISPLEQLEFLEHLKSGKLPFSERSQSITKELIQQKTSTQSSYQFYGKTGLASNSQIGWYVGWVDSPEYSLSVAVLLQGQAGESAIIPERRELAIASLNLYSGLSIVVDE